ncbi:hypothetical protein CHK_0560 [Christensenella hongkongensis]|uniref:Uncharacterized protein n=1 Tax=Christensenella hongkongensis TaxID=270498 RepID=A0A0M2NN80_9FIRM|nr:hypothetical protein CHK_0560 [Christensenella hongkongensis]
MQETFLCVQRVPPVVSMLQEMGGPGLAFPYNAIVFIFSKKE